jgi:hypothetical protein
VVLGAFLEMGKDEDRGRRRGPSAAKSFFPHVYVDMLGDQISPHYPSSSSNFDF